MVKIVAEIGINHNGDFETARCLINAAKKAGADYVKFQVFFTLDYVKQYELTREQFKMLFDHCKKNNIKWFASAFDTEAVEFLDSCGMNIWKIPSNPVVIENPQLLRKIVATLPAKILISTGHNPWECAACITGGEKRIIMHCVSEYPTKIEKINLSEILKLQERWDSVGFSDHSLSLIAPAVAVGMGATWIEKHLTLSRNQDGPDHKASLEPDEFAQMVKNVREAEACL